MEIYGSLRIMRLRALILCSVQVILEVQSYPSPLAHRRAVRYFDTDGRHNATMNSVTEGTSALIGPRPLQNRAFQGRGTFYDVCRLVSPDQTTLNLSSLSQIGQGACGRIDYEPAYIVAMNAEQYGTGYPGAECFKGITIQGGPNNGYAQAIVADLCPGCPWGGLDMSRALFQYVARVRCFYFMTLHILGHTETSLH
jgi:hypothetical protein